MDNTLYDKGSAKNNPIQKSAQAERESFLAMKRTPFSTLNAPVSYEHYSFEGMGSSSHCSGASLETLSTLVGFSMSSSSCHSGILPAPVRIGSNSSLSSGRSDANTDEIVAPDFSFASSAMDNPEEVVSGLDILDSCEKTLVSVFDQKISPQDSAPGELKVCSSPSREKFARSIRAHSIHYREELAGDRGEEETLSCAVRQSSIQVRRKEPQGLSWGKGSRQPGQRQGWLSRLFRVAGQGRSQCADAVLQAAFELQGKRGFTAQYKLGKILGVGAYGTVRMCVDWKTGTTFACKVVNKGSMASTKDLVQAKVEFLIQRDMCTHRNISAVIELFEDYSNLYTVMEYCKGGDLFSLLEHAGSFSEEQSGIVFIQVLAAVRFCHNSGILHRDIKLENILVSAKHSSSRTWGNMHSSSLSGDWRGPHVKLGDFGSAVALPAGRKIRGHVGGSRMYQAPEVLSGRTFDFKADMWSLGVLLFALLSGTFPFTAPTNALVTGMITRGLCNFSGEKWKSVSQEAIDLVQQLLQLNPCRRPSAEEVSSHPWVKKFTTDGPNCIRRTLSLV